MNAKLRKVFSVKRSYFKKGTDYLCQHIGCNPDVITKFRNTPWYKEQRKAYVNG